MTRAYGSLDLPRHVAYLGTLCHLFRLQHGSNLLGAPPQVYPRSQEPTGASLSVIQVRIATVPVVRLRVAQAGHSQRRHALPRI